LQGKKSLLVQASQILLSGSMFALLTLSIFLWQNIRFDPGTIAQGSVSSLNFQNDL
jgi:hypothetical protein